MYKHTKELLCCMHRKLLFEIYMIMPEVLNE